MTDNFVDISDGENYHSRARINRRVFTLDGTNNFTTTAFINGKVSKIIIDGTRSSLLAGSGNVGNFVIAMDIEDNGGVEYNFFDQVGGLNFTGASGDQVSTLECTPGSNKGTATSKNALHLAVSAPASATSAGNTIDEPAAWNGHLVGNCRILCTVDNPAILNPAGSIRVVIITE